MNQLDYIKSQFLKSAYSLDFISQKDEISERYTDFQNSLRETTLHVKKSTNIEEIMEHISEARRYFLLHWKFIAEHKEHPCYKKMQDLYFSTHLNLPNEWLTNTIASFEEKKSNHFIDFVSQGLNFIKKKRKNHKTDNVDNSYEVIQHYAQKIMEKYHLSHIILSNIKSDKAMNFLTTLDKNLTHVCESMGVTYDVIGIHKTVGFSSSPNTEAFFIPSSNTILLGGYANTAVTSLHEWVHALDYHVGKNIVANSYASNINQAVHINDSPSYKAFIAMKELTQEIFSHSSTIPLIHSIKEQLFKEGTSKFFSQLIGFDFYLLPDSLKQSLHTEESFSIVNNYLLLPESTYTQNKVIDLLVKQNISDSSIINKIKNPETDIKNLKTFFDSVNKNILGKDSFYHLASRFSQHGFTFTNKIADTMMKCLHFFYKPDIKNVVSNTNINDNDYLTQPLEMLARYFESQVFPKETSIHLIEIILGVQAYKLTVDSSFEKNKNNIITHVFGKDKILKNISSLRNDECPSLPTIVKHI